MPVKRYDGPREIHVDDRHGNTLVLRQDRLVTLVTIMYAAGGISYTIRIPNIDMEKLAEQILGKPF